MSDKDIIVKRVETRKDLKKFIRFNYELYKGNPYAVPDFLEDTLDTFNPRKNAAYEFCSSQLFLAWKNGKIRKVRMARMAHGENRQTKEGQYRKHK